MIVTRRQTQCMKSRNDHKDGMIYNWFNSKTQPCKWRRCITCFNQYHAVN